MSNRSMELLVLSGFCVPETQLLDGKSVADIEWSGYVTVEPTADGNVRLSVPLVFLECHSQYGGPERFSPWGASDPGTGWALFERLMWRLPEWNLLAAVNLRLPQHTVRDLFGPVLCERSVADLVLTDAKVPVLASRMRSNPL